jgi:DNA mismatch repair protein MSH5
MFRVSTLEMFSLRETMFINADTLYSLQVLDAESHPNSHNRGPSSSSGSKEGLSVYGLFHHLARTPQGRTLLRQYFLRPSLNLSLINQRLNTVGVFALAENASALDVLVQNLKSITNMRTMMNNLEKGAAGSTKGEGGLPRSVWASIRRVRFCIGIVH